MSSYTPSSSFSAAASYLSNTSSLSGVSTSLKLELYGLFKYVTVSASPNTSRPSIFDMTGRSKWDAWNSTGKKVASGQDAEQRYLEIARSLGWSEGAVAEPPHAQKEEIKWDSDDSDSSTSKGSGGGLGTAVSTMAPPQQEEDDGSLHFHALNSTNDISGIALLLKEQPDIDLNARDEFGYTALHLASDRGNLAVVKLLLEKGADPTLKDADDLSASELARIAGHDEIIAILPS